MTARSRKDVSGNRQMIGIVPKIQIQEVDPIQVLMDSNTAPMVVPRMNPALFAPVKRGSINDANETNAVNSVENRGMRKRVTMRSISKTSTATNTTWISSPG